MPKKKNDGFAKMLAELKAQDLKPKPVDVIEERKYFLIVCEGTKTEPLYFEHIQKLLPKNLLETINIIGTGANTKSVVNRAIEEKQIRAKNPLLPPFDEVWAVFDKDDFPDNNFNDAVRLAEKNDIFPGYSNQAFELWYLLHFEYLSTALGRTHYFRKIGSHLRFEYVKNSQKVVEHLFKNGNIRQAIKWAQALMNLHVGKTPAQSCPSTRVFELVRNLLLYLKHDALN